MRSSYEIVVACGRAAVARAVAHTPARAGAGPRGDHALAPGAVAFAVPVAGAAVDVAALLAHAESHGLAPIVAREWLERPVALDDRSRAAFDHVRRIAAIRGLDGLRQIARILSQLATAGVAALPYKGPVLAVDAYGDAALRTFDDLDIVVEQADVDRAAHTLLSEGYVPADGLDWRTSRAANAWHGQVMLARPDGGIPVELHWRFCDRKLPWNPPWPALMARAETRDVAGTTIRVPSREDQLVLTLLHAARHGWDRLEPIVCAGALVARGVNGARVLDRAREVRGLRASLVGLAVVERLMHVQLPGEVADALRSNRAIASLADDAQRRLERGDAGSTRDAALHLSSLDGAWARVRYVSMAAIDPTRADRAAVTLPAGLTWLYFAIRPVRLVLRTLARMLARAKARAVRLASTR